MFSRGGKKERREGGELLSSDVIVTHPLLVLFLASVEATRKELEDLQAQLATLREQISSAEQKRTESQKQLLESQTQVPIRHDDVMMTHSWL